MFKNERPELSIVLQNVEHFEKLFVLGSTENEVFQDHFLLFRRQLATTDSLLAFIVFVFVLVAVVAISVLCVVAFVDDVATCSQHVSLLELVLLGLDHLLHRHEACWLYRSFRVEKLAHRRLVAWRKRALLSLGLLGGQLC